MDAAQIVGSVMDEWKAAIDRHEPARVASVFTVDAVFQGLRPYGVGRAAVAQYYESQPAGMSVSYRILETRRPADGVVLGYLAATFTFVDRAALQLTIGVVLTQVDRRWQVAQYQASAMSSP